MYVYILCMFVCIHVCLYGCTYACMHACMFVCVCVCVCVCVHLYLRLPFPLLFISWMSSMWPMWSNGDAHLLSQPSMASLRPSAPLGAPYPPAPGPAVVHSGLRQTQMDACHRCAAVSSSVALMVATSGLPWQSREPTCLPPTCRPVLLSCQTWGLEEKERISLGKGKRPEDSNRCFIF